MAESVYLGEANGGRLVRLDAAALTQVTTAGTTPVLAEVETWDVVPLGPAGDVLIRMVIVTIRYTNGYSIRVTPKVDGVVQPAQDFSGAGSGVKDCQAQVQVRGARCSVKVVQLTRTGDLEVLDIQPAYYPLRAVP